MKAQISIVLIQSFKNLISTLLPVAKKVISNQTMRKILPNREIRYLESIIENPQIVTEPEIVVEKNPNYDECENRVIKQLKKRFKNLFDAKKSKYLDNDDDEEEEYKRIKDLEHLFEINENDDDYYKPILPGSFKKDFKLYESRGDKNKTLSMEQYLNAIMPYLKELINNHKAINNGSKEWKI